MLFVVEAIRRSSLNARYAILWLGAGAALLLFSLYRPLLDWAAALLGVAYPPSLLFGLAFLFLLADHAALLAGHLLAPRLDPPPGADGRAAGAGARGAARSVR